MVGLLWLVFLVLLVLWIIGFAVNWGAFVWILLAVALIILIGNLISGASSGAGIDPGRLSSLRREVKPD